MLTGSPVPDRLSPDLPSPDRIDLIIVGGLTVDRFDGGTSAPGGTVLHATRALARANLRVAVMTVAGNEPDAQAGIAELQAIAASVRLMHTARTTAFRHQERRGSRRLWLEELSGAIAIPPDVREADSAPAILFAPLAGEIPSEIVRHAQWPSRRGAILQGWLRSLAIGEVKPLPLSALSGDIVAALSQLDVLIASHQDLILEGRHPIDQIGSLRERFGPRPTLVVTDGIRGAWVEATGASSRKHNRPIHLAVPRVVRGKPTVGAGDIFAAHVLADRDHLPIEAAVERAMRRVAEELETRPSP